MADDRREPTASTSISTSTSEPAAGAPPAHGNDAPPAAHPPSKDVGRGSQSAASENELESYFRSKQRSNSFASSSAQRETPERPLSQVNEGVEPSPSSSSETSPSGGRSSINSSTQFQTDLPSDPSLRSSSSRYRPTSPRAAAIQQQGFIPAPSNVRNEVDLGSQTAEFADIRPSGSVLSPSYPDIDSIAAEKAATRNSPMPEERPNPFDTPEGYSPAPAGESVRRPSGTARSSQPFFSLDGRKRAALAAQNAANPAPSHSQLQVPEASPSQRSSQQQQQQQQQQQPQQRTSSQELGVRDPSWYTENVVQSSPAPTSRQNQSSYANYRSQEPAEIQAYQAYQPPPAPAPKYSKYRTMEPILPRQGDKPVWSLGAPLPRVMRERQKAQQAAQEYMRERERERERTQASGSRPDAPSAQPQTLSSGSKGLSFGRLARLRRGLGSKAAPGEIGAGQGQSEAVVDPADADAYPLQPAARGQGRRNDSAIRREGSLAGEGTAKRYIQDVRQGWHDADTDHQTGTSTPIPTDLGKQLQPIQIAIPRSSQRERVKAQLTAPLSPEIARFRRERPQSKRSDPWPGPFGTRRKNETSRQRPAEQGAQATLQSARVRLMEKALSKRSGMNDGGYEGAIRDLDSAFDDETGEVRHHDYATEADTADGGSSQVRSHETPSPPQRRSTDRAETSSVEQTQHPGLAGAHHVPHGRTAGGPAVGAGTRGYSYSGSTHQGEPAESQTRSGCHGSSQSQYSARVGGDRDSRQSVPSFNGPARFPFGQEGPPQPGQATRDGEEPSSDDHISARARWHADPAPSEQVRIEAEREAKGHDGGGGQVEELQSARTHTQQSGEFSSTRSQDDYGGGSERTLTNRTNQSAVPTWDEIRVTDDHGRQFFNTWGKWRFRHQEFLAEALASTVLIIVGTAVDCQVQLSQGLKESAGAFPNQNWAWGLGVMSTIHLSGGISGAHVNPAVTLALALFRGFPWVMVPVYWAAQLLGSFCGAAITYAIYLPAINLYEGGSNVRTILGSHPTAQLFVTVPQSFTTPASGFFTEVVATAILFGLVLAIGDDSNSPPGDGMSALILGLVVTMIGMSLGWQTGYAINPSRDLGPRIFLYMAGYGSYLWHHNDWWWLYGPILGTCTGAMIGGLLYDICIFTGGESPLNYPTARLVYRAKAPVRRAHRMVRSIDAGFDHLSRRVVAGRRASRDGDAAKKDEDSDVTERPVDGAQCQTQSRTYPKEGTSPPVSP